MKKPKILVHACCAPDALYVCSVLKDNFLPSIFFYNPNIFPEDEYLRRLKETEHISEILDIPLLEGEYENKMWSNQTHQYKTEPEKGKRCDICYSIRLKKTAEKTAALKFDFFTTVMSLSPWKKANILNQLGAVFALKYNVKYLKADFKKKDGFKKSIELSKQHNLYRQNYCGCEYSKNENK